MISMHKTEFLGILSFAKLISKSVWEKQNISTIWKLEICSIIQDLQVK